MPEIWYKDESCENYRDECHFDPPRYITIEELKASTGTDIYELDTNSFEKNVEYQRLKKERGYKYEDTLEVSEEKMKKEEMEEKLRKFYAEHLHEDAEVRLFLEGSGYFDVRDTKDNWIRIHASKGVLIILPAGIYHRFTLGEENYVKVRRLFTESPVWTAKFRSEAHADPFGKQYKEKLSLKQAA